MMSYWKATCSKIIKIMPKKLNERQQFWWKKLFRKGLGEFFYHNGIAQTDEPLFEFEFDESADYIDSFKFREIPSTSRVIVPIGGGKDSVVTLEELKKDSKIVPFIINPRQATLDCARIAGFDGEEAIVTMRRAMDAKLLEMNEQGFLNGHTPFSAMLAFYSLIISYGTRTRHVALSNESSANEPTIPGTDINHQYSKSLEFENDFRHYVETYLSHCTHYFSYLRPFTELQIAENFAQHKKYHPVFRSCNAGSKEDRWCNNCSKCLFAYLILSPFIADEEMIAIFGEDLLDKPALLPYFEELCGIAPNKPFECVGTIDEVNQAVKMILESRKDKFLIRKYQDFSN
jgi:hypothetical protein